MKPVRFLALAIIIAVTAITVTGCCRVKKTNSSKLNSTTTTRKNNLVEKYTVNKSHKRYYNKKRLTRGQIKLVRTYKELENAQKMLERQNPEGALRAIKRIQNSTLDNPYIEMQTWYMSVKIYDKMRKRSSRKRAMRKMIEAMKKMQKNPSYRNMYKDGMICKDLINGVLKKEKGKYDF